MPAMPKRRNTLTLDEDNAIRLDRLRKTRDASFKEVVNDVIRRGLAEAEKPFRPATDYVMPVFRTGKPTTNTPEEFKELMNRIQSDDDFEKMKRSSS
jgi:hypothetical protein